MFLENPSMKSMLDGFMTKKGRPYSDFEGLFGFDKIKTGLPFEILQACTLTFVDTMNWYAPYDTDVITYSNGQSVYLHIEDYNNASMIITINSNTTIVLNYMYRTDNFPAIEVIKHVGKSRKIYHIKDIVIGCGIDEELVLNITSLVIPYLTSILYDAYEVDK